MRRYLESLWFPELPAERAALLRIATGIYLMNFFWNYYMGYLRVALQPAERFVPVGPAVIFSEPLNINVFEGWMITTIVLLVLYLLGVGHRILAPIAAFSLMTLFAYRTSWQKVYHSDNLLALQVMALAITPSASALSFDAWAAKKWPDNKFLAWLRWDAPEADGKSWRYGWSVKLVVTITLITYFLAGIAKVGGKLGWGWATADNLLAQIGKNAIQKELLTLEGVTPVVWWLFQHPEVLAIPAIIALVVEIGAPLALLHRYLGYLWVVGTFGMHWGIEFMMDIFFRYPCSFVPFLPFFQVETWAGVRQVVSWIQSRLGTR